MVRISHNVPYVAGDIFRDLRDGVRTTHHTGFESDLSGRGQPPLAFYKKTLMHGYQTATGVLMPFRELVIVTSPDRLNPVVHALTTAPFGVPVRGVALQICQCHWCFLSPNMAGPGRGCHQLSEYGRFFARDSHHNTDMVLVGSNLAGRVHHSATSSHGRCACHRLTTLLTTWRRSCGNAVKYRPSDVCPPPPPPFPPPCLTHLFCGECRCLSW